MANIGILATTNATSIGAVHAAVVSGTILPQITSAYMRIFITIFMMIFMVFLV